MTDEQIKIQQAAGDITLVLKNGTEREKQSLLRVIEKVHSKEERERLEAWMKEGMPGA